MKISLLAALGLMLTTACATAVELKETIPNRMTSELVMQLHLHVTPDKNSGAMGYVPDGPRLNGSKVSGTFVGKGIKGIVQDGEGDVLPAYPMGSHLGIATFYHLKTDDGKSIEMSNFGVMRYEDTGPFLPSGKAAVNTLLEDGAYVRTYTNFGEPPAAYAWLGHSVFVSTVDGDLSGTDERDIVISVYRMGGL
ncbi:DUF3237 family protein [Pseudomonas putida]